MFLSRFLRFLTFRNYLWTCVKQQAYTSYSGRWVIGWRSWLWGSWVDAGQLLWLWLWLFSDAVHGVDVIDEPSLTLLTQTHVLTPSASGQVSVITSLSQSPPHLIHPSLDRLHSPLQTASGSNQSFFHNSSTRQTDQQTDRQTKRQMV